MFCSCLLSPYLLIFEEEHVLRWQGFFHAGICSIDSSFLFVLVLEYRFPAFVICMSTSKLYFPIKVETVYFPMYSCVLPSFLISEAVYFNGHPSHYSVS